MFSFPSLGIPRDAVLQTSASKRRGLESRGLEPNIKSGAVKWASSNQLYDSWAYVSWSRFLSGWFLFQHPGVMEGIPSHLCPRYATLLSWQFAFLCVWYISCSPYTSAILQSSNLSGVPYSWRNVSSFNSALYMQLLLSAVVVVSEWWCCLRSCELLPDCNQAVNIGLVALVWAINLCCPPVKRGMGLVVAPGG